MLLFYYIAILTSIIGYGSFMNDKIIKYRTNNLGSIGLIGIFTLILISYVTSQFFAHTKIFNLFILILGILFFLYFCNKKNYIFQNINLFIFMIFFMIIFILIFKNHDDFHYYHFPYILMLTEYPHPIGIGSLNIGFNTHSSIFFLASLFHLPGSDYDLFHLPATLCMFFANLYLLNLIYNNKLSKQNRFLILFSSASFVFINIFFYRLAEHGTDKSAMILIVIFIIQILFILNRKLEKDDFNQLVFIFILLSLIISFKALYILYLVFLIPIFYKLTREKDYLKLMVSNSFLLSSLLFLLVIFTNFLNSGCLLFPEAKTCFQKIPWGFSIEKIEEYKIHYENWAKAGAGAGYTNIDKINYIKNFNWLSNWVDNYFFNKVSDFIFSLIFILIVLFLFFKRKISISSQKIKYKSILFLNILLLFVWFFYHPALRYGGYHLFFILFFLPFSVFLQKYLENKKKFTKKITIIIIISSLIFFGRNVYRLSDENKKYMYNPFKDTKYRLTVKSFRYENFISKLIQKNPEKIKELYNKKYIVRN